MTRIRCGIGYDLHRLAEGRPLIVGGVTVPFDKGPVGHSDGDVLAHAMCDALLGAAALGDIGTHFPDSDPKWKGALMMEGTKADWFAGMLQIMGQERGLKYMRALARQQPSPREGHELLAQLIVAGEGLFDINIPAASVERMKDRGAPIEWTALGEVPAIMVGIGLSAQAPHANAAKVFLDFVLSREGQKLMQTPGRLIARGDLANEQATMLKGLKIIPVDPALAEKLDAYAKQLRSIFGG